MKSNSYDGNSLEEDEDFNESLKQIPNLRQRPGLMRKVTMQPGTKTPPEVDTINPRSFLSRKGLLPNKNLGVETPEATSVKGSTPSNIQWLYDLITCLEMVIKEPNSKLSIQKYCNIFRDLIDVEKVFFLKIDKSNTKFRTYVKGEKREVLVTERLLFKIFKETRMVVIHDTSDDRMFDPRFNKFFGTKIKNLLAIPIIQSSGAISGIAMMLNRNKFYKMTEKGVLMFSKRHELLAHLLSYLLSNLLMIDEIKQMKDKEIYRISKLTIEFHYLSCEYRATD